MPQGRGRLEVVYDLLRTATVPIKPTRWMSDAHLQYKLLKVYGPFLIEKGLIEKVPYTYNYRGRPKRRSRKTSHLYLVTDKGRDFIDFFEQGKSYADLFEQMYSMLGWDGRAMLEGK